MNFEQMEYIKEIVNTKSISLAAQNLHISQSAISQSLFQLEKELEVKLFKRSRMGTIPTEDGRNIIRKALEIVRKVEEIKTESQIINSSLKGELKIAFSPSALAGFLPYALSSFKRDFPQIKINLIETYRNTIIEKINNNIIDLGFIPVNKHAKKEALANVNFKYLDYGGEMKIILSKNSPLAYGDAVSIEDLLNYPIVIYSSEFCEKLLKPLKKKNMSINVLFTTTNSELIKKTVAEGLAFSILPSSMLRDDPYVESQRIIPISLIDREFDSDFKFACIYSKKSGNKRIVDNFLNYLL
ncbi:LysR family transcriptional regulator [Clostridium sp. BL-8]|uniref:LysR family transcriptional regulator n=1 Tax=Clostridium sp. BL-8 TaxID=349938 RepID=UPI00098C11B1|nr:LysR family transcriptional regulator [Clostridium sp. BL-8]OOM80388.1 HTH-type transcriptional regulator CysB [Clostridium sp. BL-8]